jgi:hypothetical protein
VYLHRFSGILSSVRQGYSEESKSDYKIVEEEKEVGVDQEMHGSISKDQGAVDNSSST